MSKTEGRMPKDGDLVPMFNVFVADPSKTLVPFTLAAASKVFSRTPGTDEININGIMAIRVFPRNASASLLRHFNDDTTKTCMLKPQADNIIYLDTSVKKLTITGTDATGIDVEMMV